MELVERPRKVAPEEVLMSWAEESAKEGKIVELGRSFCHRRDFRSSHAAGWWNAPLPGDLPQQKDELRDYEKLCATSEAFVYAAMIRLMLRRLARS